MEIDALVHSDLLNERLDNSTYEYSITNKANEYILDDTFSEEQASFINFLNKKPAYILELVSVFFYLKDNGYTEQSAILNKTKILKPELAKHIEEAYALYSSIQGFRAN